MTDYIAELSSTLEANKIKKIAIVDDAYDAFDPLTVEAEDKRKFRRALDDLLDVVKAADEGAEAATQTIDAVEKALSIGIADLMKGLEDEETLHALWTFFSANEPTDPIVELLRPMFGIMGTDRAAKLRPLRKIKELIENGTKAKVQEFDSAASVADMAGFDMVFLDFYLDATLPSVFTGKIKKSAKDAAKERSIKFLKDLVEQSKDEVPLVMLISSEAQAQDLPMFRTATNMMASKLSFLPKKHIESDQLRTQYAILALAKYRSQSNALWKIMETWKTVVEKASQDVLLSLRELDLHDFSYLQEHRLASEKTPLAEYLIWLLSGKLTDLVEQDMRKRKAADLFTSMTLPQAIPGRIGPTPAITDLYSAITTSRVPVAQGTFQPKAWQGDIYLDTKSHNEIFKKSAKVLRRSKNMPQVLAVLTPACDLVPGRSKDDKLKTVTMIGGMLVALEDTMDPSSYLFMLNDKPYVVQWNFKWPVTMTLDAMGPESSMAGRYQWVGRLRDMYHADLQRKLMSDVGRVGLPIAPTMSEAVGFKIMVRTGSGDAGWTTLLEEVADERAAWTFPAMNGNRAYCLREDIVWKLRHSVAEKITATDRWATKVKEKLDEPMVIAALQHPVSLKNDEKNAAPIKYRRCKNLSDATEDKFEGQFVVVFGKSVPLKKPEPTRAEELGELAVTAGAAAVTAAAAGLGA